MLGLINIRWVDNFIVNCSRSLNLFSVLKTVPFLSCWWDESPYTITTAATELALPNLFFLQHVIKAYKVLYHLPVLRIPVCASHTRARIAHHGRVMDYTTWWFSSSATVHVHFAAMVSSLGLVGWFLVLYFLLYWVRKAP